MIPLAVPNLQGNESRYLAQCVESNFVSSVGPFVTQFEELAAQVSGAKHAVATNSGTSGLHVALLALGVGAGDLVLIPTFTFIATANAVSMCGATPWLVDVTEESWTLDARALNDLLEKETIRDGVTLRHTLSGKRVAAIVAVCAAGHPTDFDAIDAVAERFALPVLVDAAAAAGATYHSRPLGAVARVAVLSFNGNKTFTAGGGGAVLANDDVIAERVRHLSTTARIGNDYDHDEVGFNYRLTNIQAAVGCAQLERAEHFLSAKRSIDSRYADAWVGTELMPFPRADWASSACWMTGAVLRPDTRHSVAGLVAALHKAGVQARAFWKPIHMQKPYSAVPRSRTPVSDLLWSRVLTLPCSTSLRPDEQETVISAVLDAVSG